MALARRDLLKVTSILSFAGKAAESAPSPSGATPEARAAWLHTPMMFPADPARGKEKVHSTVQKLAESNFNLMLPYLPTDYLSALYGDAEYLKQYPNAAWDAMGVFIDECKQAKIATEIWYPPTEYRRSPNASDFNPRLGGNPDWSAVRIDELRAGPNGKVVPRRWEDVCLQHPGARKWQMERLIKFVRRYRDINGIHLEEPGYSYPGNCVCALCRDLFLKVYGSPLPNVMDTLEAADLRCAGNGYFAAELMTTMRKENPRLVLSANGAYNWYTDRTSKGRDWRRWAELGWTDYYVPQVYSTSADTFRQRLADTIKALRPSCPTYAGMALGWSGQPSNPLPTVLHEIDIARDLGAPGVILFHAGLFTDEVYRALKTGPFRSPARLPEPKRLAA